MKNIILLIVLASLFSCKKTYVTNVTNPDSAIEVLNKDSLNGDVIKFDRSRYIMYANTDGLSSFVTLDTTGAAVGSKVVLYSFPQIGSVVSFNTGIFTKGGESQTAKKASIWTMTITYAGKGYFFIDIDNG